MSGEEWTVEQAARFLFARFSITDRDFAAYGKAIEDLRPDDHAPMFAANYDKEARCWEFRVYPGGELPPSYKQGLDVDGLKEGVAAWPEDVRARHAAEIFERNATFEQRRADLDEMRDVSGEIDQIRGLLECIRLKQTRKDRNLASPSLAAWRREVAATTNAAVEVLGVSTNVSLMGQILSAARDLNDPGGGRS